MRNILLCCIFIFIHGVNAYSQKHSLRAGVGINLINGANYDEDHKLSAGPILVVDYQYNFTDNIGLNFNAFTGLNKYARINSTTTFSGIARVIYTPFPRAFRFIKIGGGGGWAYTIFNQKIDQESAYLYKTTKGTWQLGLTGRLYAIDSGKIELYGSYDPYWRNNLEGKFGFLLSTVTVNFGVKF